LNPTCRDTEGLLAVATEGLAAEAAALSFLEKDHHDEHDRREDEDEVEEDGDEVHEAKRGRIRRSG